MTLDLGLGDTVMRYIDGGKRPLRALHPPWPERSHGPVALL